MASESGQPFWRTCSGPLEAVLHKLGRVSGLHLRGLGHLCPLGGVHAAEKLDVVEALGVKGGDVGLQPVGGGGVSLTTMRPSGVTV